MTPDGTTDQLQNKTLWSSYAEIIDVKQCYPNGTGRRAGGLGTVRQPAGDRNYHLRGRILRCHRTNRRLGNTAVSGTERLSQHTAITLAWCLWDMLTHPRYGMETSWCGGCGQMGAVCHRPVLRPVSADGFGGTEPRITCNACLTTQRKAWDVLSDFCSAMRCAGMERADATFVPGPTVG